MPHCSEDARDDSTLWIDNSQLGVSWLAGTKPPLLKWAVVPVLGTVVVGGTAYAFSDSPAASQSKTQLPVSPIMNVTWVHKLAKEKGTELVLSAETMYTHPLLAEDHMVSFLG